MSRQPAKRILLRPTRLAHWRIAINGGLVKSPQSRHHFWHFSNFAMISGDDAMLRIAYDLGDIRRFITSGRVILVLTQLDLHRSIHDFD